MVPRAWVLAVLACALVFAVPQASTPAAAADVNVTLVAANLGWHRNNPTTPDQPTITANAGDGLNLTIESPETLTLHTFDFPHFGVSMSLPAGGVSYVNITTTAADAGRWQFWCGAHSTGTDPENHTGMVGWFNLLGADTTPPTILHAPPGGSVALNTSIVIQANVTDNTAVQGVALNYTDVHGDTTNVTMNLVGGMYVATIPGQNATGTVTYFIWADDAVGNANRTATFSIAVTVGGGPPPTTPAADYTGWILGGFAVLILLVLVVLLLKRRKPASPP